MIVIAQEVTMFGAKQRGTVIAKGLRIVGSVTAEGLVEVNGQIEGELHCTSLVIARGAQVKGVVAAERVVVDGAVEGPIQCGDVILKSEAQVVGDIHHRSLAIERGAYFDGRSVQIRGNGQATEKVVAKSSKQIASRPESLSRRIERAESGEAESQTNTP
jgi:cytoskeletal protein CcmA (bactofilin family)